LNDGILATVLANKLNGARQVPGSQVDVYQVAEVVRNLALRDVSKGLSAGEKRMLAKARQILVSELTFAINVNEEEAESKLDEARGLSPLGVRQGRRIRRGVL